MGMFFHNKSKKPLYLTGIAITVSCSVFYSIASARAATFGHHVSDYVSANIGFADLSQQEEDFAAQELKAYEDNLSKTEYVIDGNFEELKSKEALTSAINDKGEDVKSLRILSEAREDLNKAQRMHNLKQTLPQYKKVYQDYADMQEQMKQAVANVKKSGECVINMMAPYYSNATAVWFGGDCIYYRDSQILCHYENGKSAQSDEPSAGDFDILCPDDSEQSCYVQQLSSSEITGGVAKYLLTLYSEAKDQDAAGDTEAFFDVSESTITGGYATRAQTERSEPQATPDKLKESAFTTTRDSDGIDHDDLIDKMTSEDTDSDSVDSSSHMKNQKKGEEEKEKARKDSLIRWVIGSEVAKELNIDLDTGEHEWGNRANKFPLWYDQMFFYDQYINGKYDNIAEYIREMPQIELLMNVLQTLNPISDLTAEENEEISEQDKEEELKKQPAILTKLQEIWQEYKQDNLDAIKQKYENSEISIDLPNAALSDLEMKLIEQEIAASEQRIAAITTKFEQKSAEKRAELERWNQILDDANTHLSEANIEYNKGGEVIKNADSTTPQAEEGIEYSRKIYAGRDLSADSPQNASFNQTILQNKKDSTQARETQTKTLNIAQRYEDIIKTAEEKIKKIKEDLELMRVEYVKQLSDAEAREKTNFEQFVAELRASRNTDILAETFADMSPLDFPAKLAQCLKDYALKQVENAKQEIQTIQANESIYYVESAGKVQNIHRTMIDKITKITVDDLAECAVLKKISNLSDNSGDKDKKLTFNILSDVCKAEFCTTPDTEYFVGAIGLPRDFASPRSPLDFSSAPVREIFHFDIIDFNNLDKYYIDKNDISSNKKIFTSAESFLKFLDAGLADFEYEDKEYASTVPIVWKYILRRHALVQKNIDLEALLGEPEKTDVLLPISNNNQKGVLRSGVFPCMINNEYALDIRNGVKDQLYSYVIARIPNNDAYENLPQCQGITLEKDKGRVVIYDTEIGQGFSADNMETLPSKPEKSSELGMILAYVVDEGTMFNAILRAPMFNSADKSSLPHRLSFNQNLLKAIATINKTEDMEDDEQAAKFYMANRVLFERNQFGDYLDQVEAETIVADELDKLEQQMIEVRQNLYETLSAAEYTVADDFSLLNQQDYDQAAEVMDAQKKLYMDLATQKLNSLSKNGEISQNIRDKTAQLEHKIAVLQKDSDEIVAINGDEALDELEEKIKTRQADIAVTDRYQKLADADAERRKKHVRAPYCASYINSETTK